MSRDSPKNRNFTFLVALGAMFIFAASVWKVSGFLKESLNNGSTLSGKWQYCIPKENDYKSISNCTWREISLPEASSKYLNQASEFTGWVAYKKSVSGALFSHCAIEDTCHLFIGEFGDSAQVSLNGKVVGAHGALPPSHSYKKNFPLNVYLPQENIELKNELFILGYSSKSSQAGLRRGPLKILPQKSAQILSQLMVAQNVVLPLLSAFLLIFMAVASFIGIVVGKNNGMMHPYFRFCIFSALFLFSFTEIPRQFFSVDIGGYLHFFIRFIYDWAFLEMVISFFQIFGKKQKYIFRYSYLAVASLFVGFFVVDTFSLSGGRFFGLAPFDTAYVLMRLSFPFVLFPGLLASYCLYKNPKKYSKYLCYSVWISTLMLISDVLVFHNVYSFSYFVKFYPFILGTAFGWEFVSIHFRDRAKYNEMRKREEILTSHSRVKRQLIHDLKSPMLSLKNLLKSDSLETDLVKGEDSKDWRSVIATSAENLFTIVEDLKADWIEDAESRERLDNEIQKKTENLRKKSLISDVQILPLLVSLVDQKRAEYNGKKVKFTLEYKEAHLDLFCFSKRSTLFRVLSNLINNAVEAMEGVRSPRVFVSLRKEARNLEILISDNGCGIKKCNEEKVFQEGFTTKESGMGLGLAHARESVSKWGGKIYFSKRQGKDVPGTTVKLVLPLARKNKQKISAVRLKENEKIVVLDDDENILRIWNTFVKNKKLHFKLFSNPADFERWMLKEKVDAGAYRFFFDYEIDRADPTRTGIELIKKYSLQKNSVLISAFDFDEKLQKQCSQNDIMFFAKENFLYSPLLYSEGETKGAPHASV